LTAFCQSEAANVKVMSARSASKGRVMWCLMVVGVLWLFRWFGLLRRKQEEVFESAKRGAKAP
jgi:hypothetical protein